MRILMCSRPFSPSVGGMESVSETLARQFVEAGHEVVVVTETAGPDSGFPFEVVRQPNAAELLRRVTWCDVFFHNGISLRAAWPLLLVRRPWVVAHHTWIPAVGRPGGLRGQLKRIVNRHAYNISISRPVGDSLNTPSEVIPNPYDDAVFSENPNAVRDRDLIFVGRLVSEKGVDVLLEALARLRGGGLTPSLTIVGSGPEESGLKAQAAELGLSEQVRFAGPKRGAQLAAELNRHRILAVPSRCNETFGVVALEGMACGCVVVGSEGGGLRDAIGPGGVTYPNGDAGGLAKALTSLITSPQQGEMYRHRARSHLEKHRPWVAAEAYLRVLEASIREASV